MYTLTMLGDTLDESVDNMGYIYTKDVPVFIRQFAIGKNALFRSMFRNCLTNAGQRL